MYVCGTCQTQLAHSPTLECTTVIVFPAPECATRLINIQSEQILCSSTGWLERWSRSISVGSISENSKQLWLRTWYKMERAPNLMWIVYPYICHKDISRMPCLQYRSTRAIQDVFGSKIKDMWTHVAQIIWVPTPWALINIDLFFD